MAHSPCPDNKAVHAEARNESTRLRVIVPDAGAIVKTTRYAHKIVRAAAVFAAAS
jgi:hypothetical protein